MRFSILARGMRVCIAKNIKIYSLYSHDTPIALWWRMANNAPFVI